jgi:CRP/FNR family transcriptional regulator, cyclic AMP receptor protein
MLRPMIDEDMLLTWGATYKKVKKDEIIFQEGTAGFYYHQLVKGKVKWYNIDEQGREFLQCLICEGESFGELPLLDDGPYVSSAATMEDCILLKLRKENFLQMLRENPVIHFRFTRLMTERLRSKFIFLKELTHIEPERKVLTVLNNYKENAGIKYKGKIKVELTRQQIANMTGLRVETVIRTIRSLHETGLLTIEKGKVFC